MKAASILFAASIGFATSAICQTATIDLSFTAKYNEQYVALDSVLIENLTQGGDTILFLPDTELSLNFIVGIDNSFYSESTFTISQNFPNPFKDKTDIMMDLLQQEKIDIVVYNIVGKELICSSYLLDQGKHHFTFYSGGDSYYVLTALGSNSKRTIKMSGLPQKHGCSNSCRIVYQGKEAKRNFLKSQKVVNEFAFSIGDELQFSGFSTTEDNNVIGSAIITDSPLVNTAYEFEIFKGIRCPGIPTITDIDSNKYYTVQIGDQCWMMDNLKTTKYKNGNSIPNVLDNLEWSGLSTGAYVWFDNDVAWKDVYGALYNWYAAVDTSGLCPTGWHVPEQDEWVTLANHIGGVLSAGAKLKSCRQINSPLGGDCFTTVHPRWESFPYFNYGTDDYGFSGIPAGDRLTDGTFANMGMTGDHWTSSEENAFSAWYDQLYHSGPDIWMNYHDKRNGHSVRCIKNSDE